MDDLPVKLQKPPVNAGDTDDQDVIVPVSSVSAGGTTLGGKEREPGPSFPLQASEKVPVVEVGRVPETLAEQEGLVKRVEEFSLQEPVKDEGGNVLLAPIVSQTPKIVLPMTQSEYEGARNLKLKVEDAGLWLVKWVGRILAMFPGRTVFSEGR